MNYADERFKELCGEILGVSAIYDPEGTPCRAHWEDGTQAKTFRTFGYTTTYNLQKEFPAVSLKKTNIKNAVDEILWIWQKKSNNVHDLNSHIWDSWADKDGSIGKAYGWQVKNKRQKVTAYGIGNSDKLEISLDQTDYILWCLKNDKYSRRIVANLYNIEDLDEMNLHPCCYSITLGVLGDTLNMVLNQRSQDVIVANNWNVVQYAILLMMFAQVSGLKPGKLTHVIADAHIYDRHIDIAKDLMKRKSYPAPTVKLNPEITDFYKFTVDDVWVSDYVTSDFDIKLPVAI